MTSELVLVFDTLAEEDVLDQLSAEFDKHSEAGNRDHSPSLIIVNKKVWGLIETEISKALLARYKTRKLPGYDKVTATSRSGHVEPAKAGFNAVSFRARPVVAIDGDNVISARVGGMDG